MRQTIFKFKFMEYLSSARILGAWALSVNRSDRNPAPRSLTSCQGETDTVYRGCNKGACCDRGQSRVGEIGSVGHGRVGLPLLSQGHLRTDLGQARNLDEWISGEECPRGRDIVADARDSQRVWVAEQSRG